MIKKNKSLVLKPAGTFLGLIITLLLPVMVWADGFFVAPPFVWNKHKDINEPTQKAILVFETGQEDLILQVKYDGPVEEFGWLVPVPGLPTVQKGSMECFYELSRYTQEHWEPRSYGRSRTQSASLGGDSEPPPPVKVIEIKTVGAYEVAVLSARDTGSLENWLNANGFSFPKGKEAVIDAYVQQQWYFVAVKINLRKGSGFQLVSGPPRQAHTVKSAVVEKLASGELQPLHLSFASDQCIFPLKISSVNGTPSEVQVYVLSPEPLVERTMFEKKFPEVRRLALERNAKRIQTFQKQQAMVAAIRRNKFPEEGQFAGLPIETNIPLNVILKQSVPYEALLPYAAVTGRDFPECSRQMPRLQKRTWWLTKQTWTFKPDEMRDLVFQPAAAVFAGDLASEEGYYVAQNLARLDTNAVPALLQALQSTNPVVRIHATSAFDDMGGGGPSMVRDPRVQDYLPVLFKDPEAEVRMDAAGAAGGDWDPKFAEPLLILLQDEDEGVRRAAAFALRRNYQGKSQNLPALLSMLKNTNLMVRASALEVISDPNAPIAREDVLPLLGSTNMRVVHIALSRLEQDQKWISYDELAPLLHSDSMLARMTGLSVLQRLDNNNTVIEIVLPLLHDPEPPVRGRAWKLLAEVSGQKIPADRPDQWTQWWAKNKSALLLADYTKAIEADPTNGAAYHIRGCFYYDEQKFPEALADYRKAVELTSNEQDYSVFRIWIIHARLGEKEAGTKELAAYLAGRKTGKPDDWPSKVGRFLAGQLTGSDFLQAAANPKAQTDQEQHCEAYFYIGSVRLVEGDRAAATDYFKKCRATEVKTFEEYQSAGAELKLLAAAK